MYISEPLKIGIGQLMANKTRSFLTILGMLIGIGSVVGVISLGEGLRRQVIDEMNKIGGSRLILVEPPSHWVRQDGRWIKRKWEEHLTVQDIERISRSVEGIERVTPLIGSGAAFNYKRISTDGELIGTNESYARSMSWQVKQGRFLSAEDMRGHRKVCVLGTEIKEDLFGNQDPVEKELKINGQRFTVIGTMEEKSLFEDDWGRTVLIPFTTAQKRMTGNEYLNIAFVHTRSGFSAEEVSENVKRILRRHHEHGDDFRVRTAESEIKRIEKVIMIMKLVVGGIAGISLLVGGIGIMNIMLASVAERTREVGIRKAVGAKKKDILYQFVIESVILSLFGGVLGIIFGILLGFGAAYAITNLSGEPFPSAISLRAIALAATISAAIGMFFGVYPAMRAAKLDPVEALRYE